MSRRFSLRWKVALLMTALIAVLSATIFVTVQRWVRDEVLSYSRETGQRLADVTAYSVSPALYFEDQREVGTALDGACQSAIVASATVTDAAGRIFAHRRGRASSASPLQVVSTPIRNGSETLGTLTLEISLAPAFERIASSRRWLLLMGFIAFGAGALVVVAISFFVTSPLASITAAAEAVRSGDTSVRVQHPSGDEIGTLASAFNAMLDRLDGSRSELEAVNRDLESRVHQRTREITLLLESTYDGVLAADESLTCFRANPAAAAILHQTPEQILGCNLHTLLHDECDDECALLRLLHGSRRGQLRETLRHAGGETLLWVSVAPVLDGRTVKGSVVTLRDMTEHDRMQEELENSRRLSSLGTLAATMAHEFNNVLMSILPFTELLRRSAPVPSTARYCEAIAQSVARGKRVTQEVLRFTRPQKVNRRTLDLARWLRDFAPTLRTALRSRVHLSLNIPEHGPTIALDREQMEQVLINLGTNARDAMNGTGTVSIETTQVGDLVHIVFADTGPGMSHETVRRVFEPFFTTKSLGGTGLGLPIALQIIEAHGGDMSVDSTPGQGTRITMTLPLLAGSTVPAKKEAATPVPMGRLLLVEDEAIVVEGLRMLLEMMGITVDVAMTAGEALQLLSRTEYDGLVLDVGLPDRDGISLYRDIEQKHPRLPVVFSTGHADEGAIAEVLTRTNVRFARKPYVVDDLLALFQDMSRDH